VISLKSREFIVSHFYRITLLQSAQVWHVLTMDHTVLPATHMFIHKRNEPYLPVYRWGAHWRHLANTTEPSMCGGNVARCQIISTTCLWSPYVIGQTIICFHAVVCSSSFFFFSSPNLSRRRLDVCHTSTHGVALVRI